VRSFSKSDKSDLDWSRFVRRDRSSPVKKNTQIILVVVGVVILFSSAQSASDQALFYKKTDNADALQHRLAWLSQIFSDASEQIRFWLRMQSVSLGSI